MKILLIRHHDRCDINTRLPESLNRVRGILPPLGLAYVAAVLCREGYDVKIIDAMAFKLSSSKLRDIIHREKADVVGVTAMTSSVGGALEALQMAKTAGAITVMGGVQMAVYPHESLSYDFIDYGIIGEGEYPFLRLIKAIETGLPVNEIPGLAYKEDDHVRANAAYIHPDLDEIPFPARHLLPNEKYSSIISSQPVTTMISSRGCPYDCGFCFKTPSDTKYRVRSAENVVDEMEMLSRDYQFNEIMFYDDTFTLRKDHVRGICDEILRRGLEVRWEAPTRLDTVDPPLLKLMRRAGCIRLRYGVESGDPDTLRLMNKGIDLSQARDVFNWTKKAGIETFAYFIIGYIYETPNTIKQTISFARGLNPDLIMFTLATPYPKTPLYGLAQQEGLVPPDYWKDLLLGARQDRLPYLVPDADKWIKRAYRRFYFRPTFMLKRLSRISSWNDVKNDFEAVKGLMNFKMNENFY